MYASFLNNSNNDKIPSSVRHGLRWALEMLIPWELCEISFGKARALLLLPQGKCPPTSPLTEFLHFLLYPGADETS